MEINNRIMQGDYEECYSSFINNLKSHSDQDQLQDFISRSKTQCIEFFNGKLKAIEEGLSQKYQSEVQALKISRVQRDLISTLKEIASKSLVFGTIIYSVSDFRLKQEKIKQGQLQSQQTKMKIKVTRLKQEAQCFKNMIQSKDDQMFQLKQKLISAEIQLLSQNVNSSNGQQGPHNSITTIQQGKSSFSLTPSFPSLQSENFTSSSTYFTLPNESMLNDMYNYSFGKKYRLDSSHSKQNQKGNQQLQEYEECSIMQEESQDDGEGGNQTFSFKKKICEQSILQKPLNNNNSNCSNNKTNNSYLSIEQDSQLSKISLFDVESRNQSREGMSRHLQSPTFQQDENDQVSRNSQFNVLTSFSHNNNCLNNLKKEEQIRKSSPKYTQIMQVNNNQDVENIISKYSKKMTQKQNSITPERKNMNTTIKQSISQQLEKKQGEIKQPQEKNLSQAGSHYKITSDLLSATQKRFIIHKMASPKSILTQKKSN